MFADTALTLPKTSRRRAWRAPALPVLAEIAVLALALAVGLATAGDMGTTVDEFNTEPYGHQALAWYLSGFSDRALFHNAEVIHLYGPWFQIIVALAQSALPIDPLTVRHALTFLAGIIGLAAVGPMARLLIGRWAGVTAIVLCLTTGYLFGHLSFSPIDVPFLAAMTWTTYAIILVTQRPLPSWRGIAAVGLLLGLCLGTRPGGVIAQAYFVGAMALCALAAALRPPLRAALLPLALRTAAGLALAWATAIAIWPWLEIGNPVTQFWDAFTFFTGIELPFTFQHWGVLTSTAALPWHYIPGQYLARLPVPFLVLLALSFALALLHAARFLARTWRRLATRGIAGLRAPLLALAADRGALVLAVAALAPIALVAVLGSTIYDGVRHILFVIPLLAVIASWSFVRLLLPLLRAAPLVAAAAIVLYLATSIATLASLHPLQYVAMNALAGGTAGAYGRFELDYWSAAATPALRRLEARLDRAPLAHRPRVMVCIGWREQMVAPLFRRDWEVATSPAEADFLIETERFPCAQGTDAVLIDEVIRAGRSFARIYATPSALK
ncbi:MAG TPA: hypothetical protein VNR11_22435 [Xanthobacteraceae bacterium]|nr:hypothetical protein [Xanthobacteraceae bacterium]